MSLESWENDAWEQEKRKEKIKTNIKKKYRSTDDNKEGCHLIIPHFSTTATAA